MATILKQRRDTAANWALSNPVIPDGQLCFDTTNNTFRIGDGTTNYNSLSIQSGTAGADGADGAAGGPAGPAGADGTGGSIEAIADGVLANGDKVILQSDGTVKIISATPTTTPASFGTGVITPQDNFQDYSICFDSFSNKIVIAYPGAAGGNGYIGTAIVGTVSGTSISFGTAVVFKSAAIYTPKVIFDSSTNKVVISYPIWGVSTAAIVGTVSGNSISFGTENVFAGFPAGWMEGTFDSNLNKVVLTYADDSNSDYGTAIVGTVSGTSISFGTAVVFHNAASVLIAPTFDSNLNKVVIAWTDSPANVYYGKAIVGTVSGTSISFGTKVTFNGAISTAVSSTFDSSTNKVVVAFKDQGNNSYGTAIVGTVSGTSISFGTKVVFESTVISYTDSTFDSNANKVVIITTGLGGQIISGSVSGTSITFDSSLGGWGSGITWDLDCVFDSNANKVVFGYSDLTGTTGITTAVYQTMSTQLISNLTTDNFIGISNSVYADTATATIQVVGSTDDAQSGLTTGSKYYVQGDGTLNTTPGVPSVYAGMSLSTTKLLIKG